MLSALLINMAESMRHHDQSFSELIFTRLDQPQMLERARQFRQQVSGRRTVRDFSPEPVAQDIITECLLAAGSAPSGANRQPWHFVVVSSSDLKQRIRSAAEIEEKEFYERRASDEWLTALKPLGTDAHKPFLEEAPYLIVVFAQKYGCDGSGVKQKNYYVTESVGLAAGLLITALHNAGLATLTHTPSPMKFLNELLDRPKSEKPLMIIVTGYPAKNARVPNITRKALQEFVSFK